MSHPRRPFCWVVGLVVSLSQVASADPIAITSGAFIGDRSSVHMDAIGERDLAITAGGGSTGGFYGPFSSCSPCLPGGPVSLEMHFSGSDFPGRVSLDGESFLVGLGTSTTGSLLTNFWGETVAPPFGGVTEVSISAPFWFDGRLNFPTPEGEPSRPHEQLIGRGTATVNLRWGTLGDLWAVHTVRYDFEPVPEPASLLLLGTGLVGLASRRLRRGQQSQRL